MSILKSMILVAIAAIATAWAVIGWMAAAGSGTLAIATLVLATASCLSLPLVLMKMADLSSRIEELERS